MHVFFDIAKYYIQGYYSQGKSGKKGLFDTDQGKSGKVRKRKFFNSVFFR